MKPTTTMRPNRSRPEGLANGFTLVEVLMVILIMAVLTGLVVGLAGFAGRKSAIADAQTGLQEIKNALEEYRIERGVYPPAPDQASFSNDVTGVQSYLRKYDRDLNYYDPWGRPYQYLYNRNAARFEFRLWSKGPDGLNGKGDDIDSSSGN